MISVLLPTARRPDMLRTALRSISKQSALRQIKEVVVSENGSDSRSEEVCAEFSNLPITYVYQNPQLPILEHAKAIFNYSLDGEFTAILHDDDWWAPGHLETALAALKEFPAAAAYHCSYFSVLGESSTLACSDNFFFWFGAGYPSSESPWVLNRMEVLLASQLGTGGIYSSLLTRTTTAKAAAKVYEENNPFDNDRMFTFALTKHGSLIYNPVPHVYYRRHPNQDTFNYNVPRRDQQMEWTAEWLIKTAETDWQEVGEQFAILAAKCPTHELPRLKHFAMFPWCLPLMAKHAKPNSPIAKLHQAFKTPTWKVLLKQLTPPIAVALKRSLSGKS